MPPWRVSIDQRHWTDRQGSVNEHNVVVDQSAEPTGMLVQKQYFAAGDALADFEGLKGRGGNDLDQINDQNRRA